MTNRRCASGILLATLFVCSSSADAAPDGITLSLAYDPAAPQVTLSWTGNQPDFQVFRSADAPTVTAPANALGVTGSRLWSDSPPAGSLFFYLVTGAPGIVTPGASDRILMSGTVVGPGGFFEGHVLIEGNALTCVAPSCSAQPGAGGATVIATNGIILPGLIDAHNHGLYNIFDETDWSPLQYYTNHNQWTNETRYHEMVDCKQYLAGESGSPAARWTSTRRSRP